MTAVSGLAAVPAWAADSTDATADVPAPDTEPDTTSSSVTGSTTTSNSVLEAGSTEQVGPVTGEVIQVAGRGDTDGVGYSGDGGPAVDARLNDQLKIAAAADGTIYLADRMNRRVRAIDADGTITTVVRALRSPDNDVDVAEGWTFSPSNTPISVDTTDDGTLVVGGQDDISLLTPDGETTVLAGGGEEGLPAAGESMPGDSITVHDAVEVAAAEDGTVYAYLGGIGQIVAIDPAGTVRLVAGGGEANRDDADGSRPATDYAIGRPVALAVADTGPQAGTVFFTAEQHSRVMAITPEGNLDVAAGTGESGFSGDDGPARDAVLSEQVGGLAVTAEGDLLIGDTYNAAIRRVDQEGIITTQRGAVGKVSSLDVLPDGDILFTRGARAFRTTVDGRPATEVIEPTEADSGTDPFAQQQPGEVAHLAGATGEPPASLQQSNLDGTAQAGVAVDPDGGVLFGDRETATVRRVESDGSTTVVAGVWPPPDDPAEDEPAEDEAAADEPAGDEPADDDPEPPETVAADEHDLNGVQDLASGPDGRVLIAEAHHIWELGPDGTMTRIFSSPTSDDGTPLIRGIATDPEGTVFATVGDRVVRVGPGGDAETVAGGGERWADDADGHPASEAELWEPTDVAVDSRGNVYLTEHGRPHVRRVAPDGTLTTVLGDSYHGLDEGGFGGDGGPGTEAEVNTPLGLVVTEDDALFVADTYNARIRRLDTDGTVTTVAGNGQLPDDQDPDNQNADGPALETPLGEPTSLALGPDGDLLISAVLPGRVLRLTGDGGLRVLAETAAAPQEAQEPATEEVLVAVHDLTVGPDGAPLLATNTGVVTVDGTTTDISDKPTERITSGAMTVSAAQGTVSRVYPDGRTVLVAGGGSLTEPEDPVPALSLNLAGGVQDVATAPDGSMIILAHHDDEASAEGGQSLFVVSADGLATPIPLGDRGNLLSVAAGPDGVIYGIDNASQQVLRLDEQASGTVVVAEDEENLEELADEPFGTATAMPAAPPQDLAVGPQGHLFVAVRDGVLVVDPEEDSYALVGDVLTGQQSRALRIASDRHGNAYLLSHLGEGPGARLSAVVRPAEVEAPTEVPWAGIAAAGAGVAVLLGAVLLWRRRRGTEPAGHPTTDQATAEA